MRRRWEKLFFSGKSANFASSMSGWNLQIFVFKRLFRFINRFLRFIARFYRSIKRKLCPKTMPPQPFCRLRGYLCPPCGRGGVGPLFCDEEAVLLLLGLPVEWSGGLTPADSL